MDKINNGAEPDSITEHTEPPMGTLHETLSGVPQNIETPSGSNAYINIDAEFKKLIPPLAEGEYRELEKNLIQDGRCRDSLVVWESPYGNILLDGHNRRDLDEYLSKSIVTTREF
ncbi:MAG: hypothetical protein HQK97_06290 [Nitrospirae bacterium]|nr:hypothetical protein [Nitrospirota bacterium]